MMQFTRQVDVGTNGGSAWTRPGSVPSRSDTVLVTSQEYNAAGWLETVTDPRGLLSKTLYDNLGRVTKTIEAYTDGTPSDDDDKTVEYTYDGAGHMLTLKALLTSGYQKTEWVYGVTTGGGSDIASNDILAAIKYPNKSTGDPSSSEQETYTVNALGEVKTKTDRNDTVHTYSYDVLGRQTADAVTTLGSGVDGAIRRIETAYDTAGLACLFTSYDAASSGNVVNQVERQFNGLGQLIKEYQAVAGAVNTQSTPYVAYTYSEMASGANHSRLTSMTYPNGKVLTYTYGSGLDNNISRLSSLSDTSGTLESYSYLGLGTVVIRSHPQPEVDLSYVKQGSEDAGDAGDKYNGLDRFGRVVDQRWIDTSSSTQTDRFQFGYDRNSNRLYRENLVDATFSELYEYDNLNQVTSFLRGELNSTKDGIEGTPTRSQEWDFDALGNFDSVTTDSVEQTRDHNAQNQITSIEDLTTPTYDDNGNMTGDEEGRELHFDAWNRLVGVEEDSTPVASYSHDALNRRVIEDTSTERALYYTVDWQVIEERESGVAVVQAVFSPVYVDVIVLRDRDTDDNGTLDERLWVQQDANFNVTALLDNTGGVVERYVYDPYGAATILTAGWGTRMSSLYAWVNLHQGGRFAAVTGLYDFRHRPLSPAFGRWVQPDPIQYVAGDVNLVRYLNNSPVNHNDPSGTVTATTIIGATATTLGHISTVITFAQLLQQPDPVVLGKVTKAYEYKLKYSDVRDALESLRTKGGKCPKEYEFVLRTRWMEHDWLSPNDYIGGALFSKKVNHDDLNFAKAIPLEMAYNFGVRTRYVMKDGTTEVRIFDHNNTLVGWADDYGSDVEVFISFELTVEAVIAGEVRTALIESSSGYKSFARFQVAMTAPGIIERA